VRRPQPARADHDKFCRIEDWDRVRDARGNTGTHHVTYELALPDGRILRTRVSHPVDRSDYGPALWRHILRDQLVVTDAEFWACVRDRVKPDRGGGPAASARSIPADVVYQLIHRVGLSDAEVAKLGRDEAIERLRQHWLSS
jgi:hypothetical protein